MPAFRSARRKAKGIGHKEALLILDGSQLRDSGPETVERVRPGAAKAATVLFDQYSTKAIGSDAPFH